MGIHAAATGSSTVAGDVGGSAVAMFAMGSGAMGGTNTVKADTVNIGAVADTAEGATVDSGNAYGMLSYVYYASSTTAQSTNTVRIDVAVGEGKDAYAMFANGRNASNTITGSAHDDVVDITGGLHAVNGGTNRIDGGDGDDTISVTGSFSSAGGGTNVIDAGAGDDTIILNGAVGSGSLTLHAGDGYDTLVLHADSYAAFEKFYSDWLLGTFGEMSIEAVRVVMHGAGQPDLDAHSTHGAAGSHATPADGLHDVFAADGAALDFDRLAGLPGQPVASAGHGDDPHGGSGATLNAADLLDFGTAGDIPLPGPSTGDTVLFSASGPHSGDWHGPAGMTVGTFDAGVSGGYESDVQLLVHQVVSSTSA